MRKIQVKQISSLVSRLCIEANIRLRSDIRSSLKAALRQEKKRRAKEAIKMLIENARIAERESIPICQDTGLVTVFIEMGQDTRLSGGLLKKAVDEGVSEGYKKGYLRKSVVRSPLTRKNTNTNTPAILHVSLVPGETFDVWVVPKGFGSENKSRLKMLEPSAGERGIVDFVVEAVKDAGPEACPPFVVGVGIGGTFDYAAHLAKKSLLRRIDEKNPDKRLASLEKEIFDKVNRSGIGPMGLGGKTTALGVNILSAATHIAGLPVAVNINCHATRSIHGRL